MRPPHGCAVPQRRFRAPPIDQNGSAQVRLFDLDGTVDLGRRKSFQGVTRGTAQALTQSMDAIKCSVCKKEYSHTEFDALPMPKGGGLQKTETEEGAPAVLILRNCSCGSTLAREVVL